MSRPVLAILGGGQLARMLALAAIPLGVRVRALDPAADAPAAACAEMVRGEYDDAQALDQLIAGADVLTYEFENVPAAAVQHAERRGVRADPAALALATAQDRIPEKECFRAVGLDTAPFYAVNTLDELRMAVAAIGLPGVLKTRRFGYDGKGQRVLRAPADVDAAWNALQGSPLIYEGFVHFDSECSLIAVRARSGEVRCWPLVSNHHRDGILRLSLCPVAELAPLQAQAERHAHAVMTRLGYVGVMTIEFFRVGTVLIGNEMAPRVHNSGHWTIEGAVCSQFENHVRAVCGLPLGSTALTGSAAMLNCIGSMPQRADLLAEPGLHVHDYGKDARPGRKVGHLSVIAADHAQRAAEVQRLARRFGLEADLPA